MSHSVKIRESNAPASAAVPEKTRARKLAEKLTGLAFVLAACAAFMIYLIKNAGSYAWYDFIAPFFALGLFTLCAVMAVPKLLDLIAGKDEFPACSRKKPVWKTLLLVMLGALVLHVAAIAIGMFIFSRLNPLYSLKAVWNWSWMKTNTDAQHYINIAENWYQKEGNDNLLIVFFPMLPILIRGFNFITGDSYLSGQIINLIATVAGSGMVYLTLREFLGEKRSVVSAFIALLVPGAIFYNSPMTEPLFLVFTFSAFFFMQRKRYVLAGLFVALSGFTRSLGVLAAVPLAFVGISEIVGLIRSKKPWIGRALLLLAGGAVSVLGTLTYLYINYSIHGDPFKFFEYQWSNWHQKACPFYDTARYIFNPYFVSTFKKGEETFQALWLPQVIAIFGSLALMIPSAKKLPASYTVYFLCYFAVSVGCTWLLSSVRYLSLAVPVIAALGLLCDKKWKTVLTISLLSAAYVVYVWFYMLRWGIY